MSRGTTDVAEVPDVEASIEELAAADEAVREADRAIEERGREAVERVAETYDRLTSLFARYEESASGTGRETFESYVEFEGELAAFEEGLEEDLPEREAFEEACELLDRRRLEEADFDRAREALAPAREVVELLDRRDRARERYRQARDAVEAERREIEDRLDELEGLLAFADADFEAPVERLRGPLESYDESVREAFREYRNERPAREVLDLIATTEAYPLVPYRSPPEELRAYLDGREIGEEPIPTLLEYAEYSRSKLAHYVDDPAEFRGVVAASRTYLERLDAGPLTIGWPPPPADELRWRVRELVAVVDRFAPGEVIERLREVRELPRETDYERLREVARARDELSETERERLRSGEVERAVEELRGAEERLEDALANYPER